MSISATNFDELRKYFLTDTYRALTNPYNKIFTIDSIYVCDSQRGRESKASYTVYVDKQGIFHGVPNTISECKGIYISDIEIKRYLETNFYYIIILPAKKYKQKFEIILTIELMSESYSVSNGPDCRLLHYIFTTHIAKLIVENFISIIDSSAARLILHKENLSDSYSSPSPLLALALASSYFANKEVQEKMLNAQSPEMWMYALYSGECLRKTIVGDKTVKRLAITPAHCGWNHKYTTCKKEETVIFPCILAALRSALWEIRNSKAAMGTTPDEDVCLPQCYEWPDAHRSASTLFGIADILEQDIDFGKIPPFHSDLIPRPADKHVTTPEGISHALFNWAFGKRPFIEYANTILFAIHTLATEDKPDQYRHALGAIEKLWPKVMGAASGGVSFPDSLNAYMQLWSNDNQLYLNPDWLMSWFAVELFKSRAFHAYVVSPGSSSFCDAERLQFHKHFSTLCMYSLFWMRCFGETLDEKFSDVKGGYKDLLESLIYLLCEYAYIDGELPRTAGLRKIMYFMWGQQAALYALAETYRDHLHHVIEVCLLGLFFMRLKNTNQSSFFRFGPSPGYQPDIRNWIVGSLLHDMGYALKLVSYPLEHLGFFQEAVCEAFWKKLHAEYKTLQKEYIPKSVAALAPDINLSESSESAVNHGVLSALIIASHLNSVDTPEWRSDMHAAIEAAALHDYKAEHISPKKHPLAFLLWFCDNLQEWDRPLLQGHQFRQSLLVNIVRSPDHATHSNRPYVRYLAINARLTASNEAELVEKTLKCRMVFEKPDEVQHYPPFTWVGHTLQMQRVKDCILPIELTLEHPQLKESSNGASRYSMVCFQTFLSEEDNGSLRLRKSDSRIVDNAALRQWAVDAHEDLSWYRYTNDGNWEKFVFSLSQCNGEPVILQQPNDFIPDYKKWLDKFRKT